MSLEEKYQAWMDEAAKHRDYHKEGIILTITEAILEGMERMKMTQEDLAKKLRKHPHYVKRMMNGDINFDTNLLADLCLVLDMKICCVFEEKQKQKYDNCENCLREECCGKFFFYLQDDPEKKCKHWIKGEE